MQEQEQPKMTLPTIFTACPVCGGQQRLGESYLEQLRDEGAIHKDSFKGGLVTQIPLLDQAHPPAIIAQQVKIKVLLVYWDVCTQCGTMYCTKFDCIDAPAQVQIQQQPARPISPGFRGFQPPSGFHHRGDGGH